MPVAKFIPPPTLEEIPESPVRTTSPIKSGAEQHAHPIQTRNFSGIPESPRPSSLVKSSVLEQDAKITQPRSYSDNLFKDHFRNRLGYRQHFQELVDLLGISSDNIRPVPFSDSDAKKRVPPMPPLVSDSKSVPGLQNRSPFPPKSSDDEPSNNNEKQDPHDHSEDLVQHILSNAEAVEDRAIIAEEKLRLLDQENDKLRKSNNSWRNLVERFEDILVSMNNARRGSGNRFGFADKIKQAETRECERKAFEERILEMERKLGGAGIKHVSGDESTTLNFQTGGKGGWEKEIKDLKREIGLLAKQLGLNGSENVQLTSQTEAVSERKRLEALVKKLSEQRTALLAGTEELHDRLANLISEKARLVDEKNQNREEQLESDSRIRELQDLIDAKIHENGLLSARINFLESPNKIEIQPIGWENDHKAFSLLKDELKDLLELLSFYTKDLGTHLSNFKPATTTDDTIFDEEKTELKLFVYSSEEMIHNLDREITSQAALITDQNHDLATKQAHITNLKHRISILETDNENLLTLNVAYAEYQAWYQKLLQTYSNMNASLDAILIYKSAEILSLGSEIEGIKRGEAALRNDVEGQMTYIAQLAVENAALCNMNLALEREAFLSARTIGLFDDEVKVFNQHEKDHLLRIQAFEERVVKLENDKTHILNGRNADVVEYLRQIDEFEMRVAKLESEKWGILNGIGESNSDHVDEIVALQKRIEVLECAIGEMAEVGKCGHVDEVSKLEERIEELASENREILKRRAGVDIDNLNLRKDIEDLKVALSVSEDVKMSGECGCGIDKSLNDKRLSDLKGKLRELYLECDRLEEENRDLKVKDLEWEDKKDTLTCDLIVVGLERDSFRTQMHQLLIHREELRQKNEELSGRIKELSQENKELARKVKSYETHAGRRHFTLPGETPYTLPSSPLEKGFGSLTGDRMATPSKMVIPKIRMEDKNEDGSHVARYSSSPFPQVEELPELY